MAMRNQEDSADMIINLHGFNSAGNNNAFAQLSACFEPDVKVISPSYTVHNFTTGMAEIIDVLQADPDFADTRQAVFVGSSTGALFAESLARQFQGRVVLINPVVDPVQLKPLIGPQKNYASGVEYDFTQQDWNTFEDAQVDVSLPRLVFFEKGDEKLDHRLTRARYAEDAYLYETNGDSHRYTHWAEALPQIRAYFFNN